MKKVLSVLFVLLLSVTLVGCFSKKDTDETLKNVVVENDTTGEVADEVAGEEKFSEYQLKVSIVSTDADGNEYAVKTKMYKKGDKSLYVIDEMTGPEELPFKPNKNLLIGTDLYTSIDMSGETMWFKAPGVQQEAANMFDLEDMQESLVNSEEVEKTEEEEIDGETMTCYYMKNSTGKACLKDGIFAYGEDTDPVSGMSSVIKVSDYSTSVDDSVFEVPSDEEVKDMSEFMAMMTAEMGTGEGAAVEGEIGEEGIAVEDLTGIVPEEAMIEGEEVVAE